MERGCFRCPKDVPVVSENKGPVAFVKHRLGFFFSGIVIDRGFVRQAAVILEINAGLARSRTGSRNLSIAMEDWLIGWVFSIVLVAMRMPRR